ncbi:RES family NAD+ phosphorylase [Pontibacter sp. 172403-2]|uniref:RES family NAD+ phosphorylase n=1 Tax=Pontibacter rufus TaxID=2791028 RepID=UPI0018AF630E|nr:RES family NAD+ phosphorylase [Pontibacter sp. 172403-2]MBF9255595.1 RES family NAD+ phosphorylase [Pontibacter sp. 172403-2]
MMVYRLSRGKYKYDLSGKGAEMAGGRWNSKGVAMLYTSESIALCAVEIAVHMPLGIVPADYYLIKIQLPQDVAMKEHPLEKLPADWKSFPHANETQEIGDAFVLENEFLAMKVPSATVQGTYNYLINPNHKDFRAITIVEAVPFTFDKRLFVKE